MSEDKSNDLYKCEECPELAEIGYFTCHNCPAIPKEKKVYDFDIDKLFEEGI